MTGVRFVLHLICSCLDLTSILHLASRVGCYILSTGLFRIFFFFCTSLKTFSNVILISLNMFYFLQSYNDYVREFHNMGPPTPWQGMVCTVLAI